MKNKKLARTTPRNGSCAVDRDKWSLLDQLASSSHSNWNLLSQFLWNETEYSLCFTHKGTIQDSNREQLLEGICIEQSEWIDTNEGVPLYRTLTASLGAEQA